MFLPPSRSLPPRGRCLHAGCSCGGTLFQYSESDYGESPRRPDQSCLCQHPYRDHLTNGMGLQESSQAPTSTFSGSSHPFGHFSGLPHRSSSSSAPSSTDPPPHMSFDLFNDTPGPAPSSQSTFSFFNSPDNTATDSTLFGAGSTAKPSVLPSPLVAFGSAGGAATRRTFDPFTAPQAPPGSVQETRRASIHRMHDGAGTSPRKRALQPATPPSTSQPFGVAADSSDAVRPGFVRYLLCMIPFTVGDHEDLVHPSPPLALKTSLYMREMLETLSKANLVLTVDLRKNTAICKDLGTALCQHLLVNGIDLPLHPDQPESTLFEHVPWQLLEFRNSNPHQLRNFTASRISVEHEFTTKELSKISKKARHPSDASLEPLFFMPLWGNLRGRAGFTASRGWHTCFPWWVFHGSPLLQRDSESPVDKCITGCPDHVDEGLTHVVVPTRRRRVPSGLPSEPAKRFKFHDDSDYESSSDESDLFPTTLPVPSKTTARATPAYIEVDDFVSDAGQSDAGQSDISPPRPLGPSARELVKNAIRNEHLRSGTTNLFVGLPAVAVLLWRTDVCTAVNPDDVTALEIVGPSVDVVAVALESLVRTLACGHDLTDFKPADSVDLTVTEFPGFFVPDRSFKVAPIGSAPQRQASGQGVERSVYVRGLGHRVNDTQRWTKSGGMYFRPKFYGMRQHLRKTHITEFTVDGAWAALYLISLGVGPDPLCPFMLLAATRKDTEWMADLTLECIDALDPSAAEVLAPWFEVTADTVFQLGEPGQHPILPLPPALVLVATLLPIPITEFAFKRTPEFHRTIHIMLLCFFFFGIEDPYSHPEFIAFLKGFNIRLKGSRTLLSHCADVDHFKRLLAATYNQRIKAVDDVLKNVKICSSQSTSELVDLQQTMFQLRVIRWLRGVGYPRSLRGTLVSNEEFLAQQRNPLIRAERFLYALSEMRVIPADDEFALVIHLCRPVLKAGEEDRSPKLFFHDCVTQVDVPLNAWTDNILLQRAEFGDDEETEFDRWMSSEFSLQGGDYNSA
ncbi:hypothetical protein DFH06DRAFT_1471791 [Mycena polygramma]|nr:hypothetical protein DFH06DRAFT_1471791 [Mycena polygramma]